jgi:hypothetical protein
MVSHCTTKQAAAVDIYKPESDVVGLSDVNFSRFVFIIIHNQETSSEYM